jgi:uncharacterized membrane protein
MSYQRNLATWERALSLAVGAALLAIAVKRRRYLGSAAMSGLSLVARGASGYCPVSARTGFASLQSSRVSDASA